MPKPPDEKRYTDVAPFLSLGAQAKKPEDPKEKERTREKLLKQRLKQKSASLDKVRWLTDTLGCCDRC